MRLSRGFLTAGGALTVGAMVIVANATMVAAVLPTTASSSSTAASILAARNAAAWVASRPTSLHASTDDVFMQGKVISSSGVQYVPYERTYHNLPVVGGDFVVVTDNSGRVVFTSIAQEHAIGNLSTNPRLTKAVAETIAKQQLRTVNKTEGTRLVVHAIGASAARLAWESTISGTDTDGPSRLTVDVDAINGRVLRTQEHVMHGSATGAWNGPAPLTVDTTSSGGSFLLQSPSIANMPCQDAATNTTFTKPTDTWGDGDATNKETGCVDALYGAEVEARMLSQWLGRNGQDGNGGAWPIRVGLADVNAYYDGTQVQIGHNNANQWIGAIDVIAHEMGHGIDDHTPGGISGNGTQEWIADSFGASTEFFTNEPSPYAVPDFLVGNQVNLVGSGPIRNMYHPSLINGDPDCYSASIPNTEVHSAAGPGNHWFYLLAEGSNPSNGQPTSPTCNNSTVVGLGIQNTIKILYNAMLMKTSASSYLAYRTWTLQAAKNLFPDSCTQFNTVKAAWDAVSVPAQTGDPTCTGSTTLTLANLGKQTGTVDTAASLTLSASDGTIPYTFSATGLPAGLSINTSTGVISGIPTTAGTFSVSATVTDNASPAGSVNTTFTWIINPTGGGGIGNGGFKAGNLSGGR